VCQALGHDPAVYYFKVNTYGHNSEARLLKQSLNSGVLFICFFLYAELKHKTFVEMSTMLLDSTTGAHAHLPTTGMRLFGNTRVCIPHYQLCSSYVA